jgi:hypothetical protein
VRNIPFTTINTIAGTAAASASIARATGAAGAVAGGRMPADVCHRASFQGHVLLRIGQAGEADDRGSG